VDYGTAFLFIDGDNDATDPPSQIDDLVFPLCGRFNAVVAVINQVPNQPIIFAGTNQSLIEDQLIAYTWSQFFNNTSKGNVRPLS
jgi:PhoPQ-activated pathogenicity-related protein